MNRRTVLATRTALMLSCIASCGLGSESEPLTKLAKQPELPRAEVDTTMQSPSGNEIIVRRDDNLQRAIDRAQPGDTIRIDHRGEWPAIVLPAKKGEGWIHIESLLMDSLPPEGERVSIRDALYMPTILNITSGTPRPALNTELRASHYRIMGVQFKSRPYKKDGHNKMLMLGRGKSTMLEAKSPDDLPHHIIIDRCIVEGWPGNTTRGLYLDGRHVAVVGCQIADITDPTESIGILVTDTPGPILIENNEIGVSGVNIFLGDNNALRWKDVNAEDVTIRGNLLYKRPEWIGRQGLKNHFEMKSGERVLFEKNECVYSPVSAQVGFAIKLKTGGHDQYVEDVTIRHNRIRQVNGYLAISNRSKTTAVRRVLSHDNVIESMFQGSTQYEFYVANGASVVTDVAFLRDELYGSSVKSLITLWGSKPCVSRFECRDLQAEHGQYGVKGDGAVMGIASLAAYCNKYLFQGNTLYGVRPRGQVYPRGNYMKLIRRSKPRKMVVD